MCSRLLAVALSVALAAWQAIPPRPEPEPPRNGYRIVCIGDSITQGSLPESSSYPSVLSALIKAANLTQATWRRTTRAKEAFASRPDIAVVMLGTNDAYQLFNEKAFREAYAKLVAELKALVPCPRVFLCVPPPVYSEQGSRMPIINEQFPFIIPQIANASGAGVIDVFNALGGSGLSKPQLFPDCLHPNEEGNRILARTVFEALREPLHLK
eukprot:m51a1_g11381 putative xylanase (212) ;mRNA; r:2560-3329